MAVASPAAAPRLATRRGATLGGATVVVMTAIAASLLPPALALALLGAFGLGALLLARPGWGVYLLVVAVPYESLHEVQLGGLNATVTEFIAFCAGAAFLIQSAIRSRFEVRWSWWRWPVLVFAAAMVLSVTQASDVKLSIKELLKLGEMLLAYLLVLKYVRGDAQVRRLVILITIVAASEALLGMVQTVAHFGPASFLRGAVLRASGTFDQPNPFAGYLNFTLPLLFAGVVTRTRLAGRLTAPVLVLLAAGVLLSVSRGALLASIAAVIVIVAIAAPRSRAIVAAGGVGLFALAAGAVFGIVPGSLTDKVASALGLSNVDVVNPTPVTWPVAERLAHMLAGLNMFADHPWLGVGIGNYPAAYPKYQVAPVWVNPLGHAHNYYINVAAEAGVVGLAAFLLMQVAAFVVVAYAYRRAADPYGRTVALGAIGVLVTVTVQNFFDNVFVHAMEAQLALVIGLATVAAMRGVEGTVTGGKDGHAAS